MVASQEPNLRPRNGSTLRVAIVARISTEHQDRRSIADQVAKCKEYLAENYDGSADFIEITSQGSGEHLDRAELTQLEELIESDDLDLVLTEDLARICRRKRAYDFCELCEDHGTRLIAINDRVDTNSGGWQDNAFIATWHHERSNRDTSDRIKRSLNNRFDNGQLIEGLIFGYIRPVGARTDAEVSKDPEAEPIFVEMFRRLEEGASYSEIADWLNHEKVAPGPACRSSRWACSMVGRLVHNQLLKGIRIRNRRTTVRQNKSGRHRSVKADSCLLRERKVPHLAFFDAAYFDHVIRTLDERNANYRRGKNGEKDPRKGVPRKRTSWPGQHARCGICGRLMYWTRIGTSKALFCSGAQTYRCWNSLAVSGDRCQSAVCKAIIQVLRDLPDFDEVFGKMVRQRLQAASGERESRCVEHERQLVELDRRIAAIVEAIETQRTSPTLRARLSQLESERSELQHNLQLMRRKPVMHVALPTAAELRSMAEELFENVAIHEPEAGRQLNALVPEFLIFPYRACDNGVVVPRAHLNLSLAALLPREIHEVDMSGLLDRTLIVDLFDIPQRVRIYDEVSLLRQQGLTQRQIANRLSVTQPAVQNSIKLLDKMRVLGLMDPYVRLINVPESYPKLRRHRHRRFRFEPLDGFPLTK